MLNEALADGVSHTPLHMVFTDPTGVELPKLFELGTVRVLSGVSETLSQEEVKEVLAQHQSGDWGYLCPEDKVANDLALQEEGQLRSIYYGNGGTTRLQIITEADRSVTTVLLPEEY